MSSTIQGCSVGTMSEYRGAPSIDCSGHLHLLTFQWNVRGGYPTPEEKPVVTTVCEAHVSYFTAMGTREAYQYQILLDETVEPTIKKEKE